MNGKTLAKLLAFSGATICMSTTPGLADGKRCDHVGGGILTNFLQAADCAGSPVQLCTDGPATGDLRGAVGVTVLAINGMSCTTIITGSPKPATTSSSRMPI
jgi:hypothetical protein